MKFLEKFFHPSEQINEADLINKIRRISKCHLVAGRPILGEENIIRQKEIKEFMDRIKEEDQNIIITGDYRSGKSSMLLCLKSMFVKGQGAYVNLGEIGNLQEVKFKNGLYGRIVNSFAQKIVGTKKEDVEGYLTQYLQQSENKMFFLALDELQELDENQLQFIHSLSEKFPNLRIASSATFADKKQENLFKKNLKNFTIEELSQLSFEDTKKLIERPFKEKGLENLIQYSIDDSFISEIFKVIGQKPGPRELNFFMDNFLDSFFGHHLNKSSLPKVYVFQAKDVSKFMANKRIEFTERNNIRIVKKDSKPA